MIEDMAAWVKGEEDERKREKKEKGRVLTDKAYEIQCVKCYHMLCQSSKIRSILDTNYVCLDPAIWSNIQVGESDRPTVSLIQFIKQSPLF
jgi:hypothetical protein